MEHEKIEKYKLNSELVWDEWNIKKNNFEKYANVKSDLIYGSNSSKDTLYSIIIPTFRRAEMLGEAIESAINQKDYQNEYEIIVIDNDSSIDEKTDKLMKKYCEQYNFVKYYRNNSNIGLFGNWNRCIELCTSKWFCMLHDDDLLREDYLKTMSGFKLDNNIGIVFNEQNIVYESEQNTTNTRSIIERINSILNKLKEKSKPKIVKWNYPQAASSCATLYNTNLCLDIGGFDERFYPSGDWTMWAKMAYYYNVMRTGEKLSYYRLLCNTSFLPEVQKAVLNYSLIFNKVYNQSMNISGKKLIKKYSTQVIRTYMDFCSSDSSRNEFYLNILKELCLEEKYYRASVQRKIYFKYLIRQGLEKIFVL